MHTWLGHGIFKDFNSILLQTRQNAVASVVNIPAYCMDIQEKLR